MSWTAIALLGAGTFALRAAGLAASGRRCDETARPAFAQRALDLLPAAILAALVALGTVSSGQALAVDARTAAVAAAAVAVAARLPLYAVVIVAAAVAAALRQLGVS